MNILGVDYTYIAKGIMKFIKRIKEKIEFSEAWQVNGSFILLGLFLLLVQIAKC